MVGWQNIKNTRFCTPLRWDYQRPRTCNLQSFVWFLFLLLIELVRSSFVQYKILEVSLSVSRGGRAKRSDQTPRSETHSENNFLFDFGDQTTLSLSPPAGYRYYSIHTFLFMEETHGKRTVADSIVTNAVQRSQQLYWKNF